MARSSGATARRLTPGDLPAQKNQVVLRQPPGFQSVRLVPIDGSEELAEPGVHFVEAELRGVEIRGRAEAQPVE